MARESYVFDPVTHELVPKAEFYASRPRPARSDLGFPMLIRDYLDPGRSQLDGQFYDSKSALAQSYRDYEARTGRKVEVVGNDTAELMTEPVQQADDKAIDAAIKGALEKHAA